MNNSYLKRKEKVLEEKCQTYLLNISADEHKKAKFIALKLDITLREYYREAIHELNKKYENI